MIEFETNATLWTPETVTQMEMPKHTKGQTRNVKTLTLMNILFFGCPGSSKLEEYLALSTRVTAL